MLKPVQSLVTVLGRLLLCTIFLMAAVGNKIPHFSATVKVMDSVGIPAPQFMLIGAIVFLILGSVSVIVGYRARIGATLLLVFLALATYYFHNFWAIADPQAQQEQMIQFMKNLSMLGGALLIALTGAAVALLPQLRGLRAIARGAVAFALSVPSGAWLMFLVARYPADPQQAAVAFPHLIYLDFGMVDGNVLPLDEFQAVRGFDGGSVEHAVRAAVQHQRSVGYVFAGFTGVSLTQTS